MPMTTHTPPTTSTIAPLASPSRSWVINSAPSYTVPTLPPSPTLPSSALPVLFVEGTRRPIALSRCRRAPLGLPLHPFDHPALSFCILSRTDIILFHTRTDIIFFLDRTELILGSVDLCSWSSQTPLQHTAILLGSSSLKLFRKHDKA